VVFIDYGFVELHENDILTTDATRVKLLSVFSEELPLSIILSLSV